ncbi:MAG: AzlD domain-containing protein [Hyphomicrobiales bacterium]
MTIDPATALAIAAMAIVTLATWVAGLWLVRFFTFEGRNAAALEAVPAAVLMSVIAPMVFLTGPAETLAAALTLIAAFRLPLMAAVAIGVGAVVLLRGTIF